MFGNTVLPLPFHGMKSYPPSKEDNYPNEPELKKYNDEYNTRRVKSEDYHDELKEVISDQSEEIKRP
jgi:hypothetical protein